MLGKSRPGWWQRWSLGWCWPRSGRLRWREPNQDKESFERIPVKNQWMIVKNVLMLYDYDCLSWIGQFLCDDFNMQSLNSQNNPNQSIKPIIMNTLQNWLIFFFKFNLPFPDSKCYTLCSSWFGRWWRPRGWQRWGRERWTSKWFASISRSSLQSFHRCPGFNSRQILDMF